MSRRDPGGRYAPPGGPVQSLRTRVNGDYSSGSSSSSVSRELDELMRIIESDWMMMTRSNVRISFYRNEQLLEQSCLLL